MIEPGALLAAFAAGSLIFAAAPSSRLASRLERIAATREGPRIVSVRMLAHRSVTLRLALAALGATLAVLGGLPFLAPLAGYLGYGAPALRADRLSEARRREADRALLGVVEWADALAAAGRPAERALLAVARHRTGAVLLDGAFGSAADASALGAPLFRSLAARARENGLTDLARIADALERSRDLGSGSRSVLAEARDALRARERTRALGAAARVDTKLMAVLVLCYLPALMLLVVVPLFLGLLGGMLG